MSGVQISYGKGVKIQNGMEFIKLFNDEKYGNEMKSGERERTSSHSENGFIQFPSSRGVRRVLRCLASTALLLVTVSSRNQV